MRINKFVAQASDLSRRAADAAIDLGKVLVNNQPATHGLDVNARDIVVLDGKQLALPTSLTTIMLNKPVRYVVSRDGQGSKTVYELLPPDLHHLKPVGRLDKDSSGLLLMTNDGELANQLTHPRFGKEKIYEVELDRALTSQDQHVIEQGVLLEDGVSKLQLHGKQKRWTVTMQEGRNRQIRRTFESIGYTVIKLHRIQLGPYSLGDLPEGKYLEA